MHVGRAQVGVVTSGDALADAEEEHRALPPRCQRRRIGTEVEIGKLDGHQKRLPAHVVRFPHYDPEKTVE